MLRASDQGPVVDDADALWAAFVEANAWLYVERGVQWELEAVEIIPAAFTLAQFDAGPDAAVAPYLDSTLTAILMPGGGPVGGNGDGVGYPGHCIITMGVAHIPVFGALLFHELFHSLGAPHTADLLIGDPFSGKYSLMSGPPKPPLGDYHLGIGLGSQYLADETWNVIKGNWGQ